MEQSVYFDHFIPKKKNNNLDLKTRRRRRMDTLISWVQNSCPIIDVDREKKKTDIRIRFHGTSSFDFYDVVRVKIRVEISESGKW